MALQKRLATNEKPLIVVVYSHSREALMRMCESKFVLLTSLSFMGRLLDHDYVSCSDDFQLPSSQVLAFTRSHQMPLVGMTGDLRCCAAIIPKYWLIMVVSLRRTMLFGEGRLLVNKNSILDLGLGGVDNRYVYASL